jgi:hypothetical protein
MGGPTRCQGRPLFFLGRIGALSVRLVDGRLVDGMTGALGGRSGRLRLIGDGGAISSGSMSPISVPAVLAGSRYSA